MTRCSDPDKKEMEEAFVGHEKLLHSIAWSFHKTTGIPEEDLFSEACYIFVSTYPKYDPKKSKLSTYLHNVVSNRLKSFCANQNKIKTVGFNENIGDETENEDMNILDATECFDIPDESANIEESVDSFNIGKLSEPAREICRLILESPMEFSECLMNNGRSKIYKVIEFLNKKHGWLLKEINPAIEEIRECLRSA